MSENCNKGGAHEGYCYSCALKLHVGPFAEKCSFVLCDRYIKSTKLKLCSGHLKQRNKGIELTELVTTKDKKGTGRGGLNHDGYRLLSGTDHPNARQSDGKIFEHVYVMSEYLGRPLLPNENVHHKNGIRDDNRIENLELWTVSQPSGQRVADRLADAKALLKQYYADYQEPFELTIKL